MAVKNDKLGGTDWVEESVSNADLNDTFDASGHWVIQETKTISGVATITFSGLPSKKIWKLVGRIINDGANQYEIGIQFNADTGNNYDERYVLGTTFNANNGGDIRIINMEPTTNQTSSFELIFEGRPTGNCDVSCSITSGHAGGDLTAFGGRWNSPATVTSITILNTADSNNFSGNLTLMYWSEW